MHPPSDFVSTEEPPTSHSPSWTSQVTPQHELDFTNPCGEGRLWVAKLLPSHGFRRAGQGTRLGQECSHSGPARPSRLPPALHLQQQQELGRTQPIVRRAVGVPGLCTAGQEGSLSKQQGNTWPINLINLSGLSGLSRSRRVGQQGSCELQAQESPAAQRQQGLDAVAP